MEGVRHGKATLLINNIPNTKLTGRSNVCKVWFSLESKERARCEEIDSENTDDRLAESLQQGNDPRHRSKRRKLNTRTAKQQPEHEDDLSMFRNIRLGRSVVTQSTKDKTLEELRITFPALNLRTLTSFLEKCNGDVGGTITSLRNAISTYEIITKDTTTFSAPQEIAELTRK